MPQKKISQKAKKSHKQVKFHQKKKKRTHKSKTPSESETSSPSKSLSSESSDSTQISSSMADALLNPKIQPSQAILTHLEKKAAKAQSHKSAPKRTASLAIATTTTSSSSSSSTSQITETGVTAQILAPTPIPSIDQPHDSPVEDQNDDTSLQFDSED